MRRLVWLLAIGASGVFAADPTFVWIPDPHLNQQANKDGITPPTIPAAWVAQTNWIAAHQASNNIQGVFMSGDITVGYDFAAYPTMAWDYGWNKIDAMGVPYLTTCGNHDYPWDAPANRDTTDLDTWLGYSRISGKPWFGGYWNAPVVSGTGSKCNEYVKFDVGTRKFLVLSLEFFPRPGAIAWAAGVIQANTDREVIVITHGYLNPQNAEHNLVGGSLIRWADFWGPGTYNLPADNYSGEQIAAWAQQFPNVRAVLSGHNDPPAFVTRRDGNVLGIQSDYQDTQLNNTLSQTVLLLTVHPNSVTITNWNTTADAVSATYAPVTLDWGPPQVAQPWYHGAWPYRKIKAVDHRRVLGDLANFPLYIAFDNDADMAGHLMPNCGDFLVTLDGTKLDSEILACDAAKGTVHAFVRVPSLSSTADTPLLVYYGNPNATDQSNAAGVWDSSTKMVLNFRGGALTDSTSNHINATKRAGAPAAVSDSPIGPGLHCNGILDSLTTASAPVSSALTLQLWFKADTRTAGKYDKAVPLAGNSSFGFSWDAWEFGYWQQSFYWSAGGANPLRTQEAIDLTPAGGRWYLGTMTWDGSNLRTYLDGGLVTTVASGTLASFSGGLSICGDGTHNTAASIAGIQLANGARSKEWIATQAANQKTPEAFFRTGAQQTQASVNAAPTVDSFTATYASVEAGKPTALRWVVSNAASVSIDNGVGSQSGVLAGMATVSPTATTTYTLTATNGRGSTTATVTVNVLSGPVAYLRYGWPASSWLYNYTLDGSGHPVIRTYEPHNLTAGDVVSQFSFVTTDAAKDHNYASNLNGHFLVKSVVDATRYTITTLSGEEVTPNDTWATGATPGSNQPGSSWMGRTVPYALGDQPRGYLDGLNGTATRHVGTSTNNGLTSLMVAGGVATVTLGYDHDLSNGDRVTVWNTTATGDLNGEHVATKTAANKYTFATTAPNGDYTHNDHCGPSAGNQAVIGGTENCVVVSQFAVSTNPQWVKILSDTNWSSDSAYKHAFDGGPYAGGLPARDGAAYRLWVDRKNQRALNALLYWVENPERSVGVNFAVQPVGGSGACGGRTFEAYSFWGFMNYAAPYSVPRTLGFLSAAQKKNWADKLLNDIAYDGVENQCHIVRPQQETVASGTAQGGDGTHITLAASDTAPSGYYVNNIVQFYDGTNYYMGLVTAYNAATKSATVASITRVKTLYGDDYETSVSAWTAPTSSTQYKILATATISGTTVTGVHTNWGTTLHVGDGVLAGRVWHQDYPYTMNYVAGITSATNFTSIGANYALLNATPQPIWIIPKWKAGDCGFRYCSKFNRGGIGAHPLQYPPQGGSDTAANTWHRMPAASDNEQTVQDALRIYSGGAVADDDPRGVNWLEEGQTWVWDQNIRFDMMYTTPLTNFGTHYTINTVLNGLGTALMSLHTTVPNLPLPDPAGMWMSNIQRWKTFWPLVDTPGGQIFNETFGGNSGSGALVQNGTTKGSFWVQDYQGALAPNTDTAKRLKDYIAVRGLTDSLPSDFAQQDFRTPRLDFTQQPKQYFFTNTETAACREATGWTQDWGCGWYRADAMVSKTHWTDRSSTNLVFQGRTFDGSGYDNWEPGKRTLYKVGYFFNWDSQPPGNSQFYGGDPRQIGDVPDFGTSIKIRDYGNTFEPARAYIARWAGGNHGTWSQYYGDAASRYVYAMSDMGGGFVPVLSRVQRHEIHFKKPGTEEVVIERDDIDGSNLGSIAGGIRVGLHFTQNGEAGTPDGGHPPYQEGTTTCSVTSTCDHAHTGVLMNANDVIISNQDGHAADTAGPARTWGTRTRILSPDPITLRWDGDTWTGALGHSDRVSICAGASCGSAANRLDVIKVTKISSLSDSNFTVTAINPDTNWTGVQTADKVAMFARGGALRSSTTFTTTHAGTAQYLVAGLAAGTYVVTVNGDAVAGGPFTVADNDNSLYFESLSGTISIRQGSMAVCSIRTATMPDGTVGVPYSQAVQTADCTAPMTWALAEGPVCPGLAVDASGTVVGVPKTGGGCSFTVQVTDALQNTATQPFSVGMDSPSGMSVSGQASRSGSWR